MRKPVIGITPSYNEDGYFNIYHAYVDMVVKAGGCPIILHYGFDEPELLDGLVMSGGGDVSPEIGGYAPCEQLELSGPERDGFETRIFKQMYDAGKPVLGICRGHQIINCAFGGTLIPDLHAAGFSEEHRLGTGKGYHPVTTVEGSLFRKWAGEHFDVWSTHHQAVDRPGDGLFVTARSPEGVVEGIEHVDGRVLGFQTHPERMGFLPPFTWLVDMAKG